MGEELTVEVLKQLPLAVVAMVACVALWRKLQAQTADHIKDLRDNNQSTLADLRARVMVIEDNLHIQRADRYKYLPNIPIGKAEKVGDLD